MHIFRLIVTTFLGLSLALLSLILFMNLGIGIFSMLSLVPLVFFVVLQIIPAKTVSSTPPPELSPQEPTILETPKNPSMEPLVPETQTIGRCYDILEEPLALLENLFPVLESLSSIVSKKIETSAQSLGQEVFKLSDSAQILNEEIDKTLKNFTTGEHSLSGAVLNLQQKMVLMDSLFKVFEKLKSGFNQSLSSLKKTSSTIHDFSENISDLADQTNILAINASIEAARVGSAGKGFAVIANQVQILSKQSKSLAEKMAVLVKDVVQTTEKSFENNNLSISEAIKQISTGKNDMGDLVQSLGPKVEQVQESVYASHRMVDTVSKGLKEITVTLQFQDITKQILDHVISILSEIRRTILESPQNNLDLEKIQGEPFKTKAHELASQFFTVEDEWTTVNVDPQHLKNKKYPEKSVELF